MSETAERVRTLKELRVGSIMTQKQAADALGLSLSAYNRLERGETQPRHKTYHKIVALFEEEVYFPTGTKPPKRKANHHKRKVSQEEKTTFDEAEKKFLKTCWNMRDALSGGRMIVRDIVDATYEYMESYEAVTYLYKWSKIGFYHFIKGGVIDQGYFLWDKLPAKYKKAVN